jgi:hypothetical protein
LIAWQAEIKAGAMPDRCRAAAVAYGHSAFQEVTVFQPIIGEFIGSAPTI